MIPEERTWQVSEAPFQPSRLSHTETIYTVGNGYMGLRASFEEGYPGELVSTLIHGVYDHAAGQLVPELVNLPNPLALTIEVDGEAFRLDQGKVLGYQRMLNLKTATLERGVLWTNSQGTVVQITFERFASLESEHLLAQRITVRALTRPCNIAVVAMIDGTQTNRGVAHWGTQQGGSEGKNRLFVTGTTAQSGYTVAVMSSIVPAAQPASAQILNANTVQPTIRLESALQAEQIVEFTRLTAIHSSRDAADPLEAARHTLDVAEISSYSALKDAHIVEWAKYWHDCGIEIEGDEVAQRAVRFGAYHVLIAAPRHDEHASIGAKTLSGPGYNGHVFWDTELFMLPLLTVTQPHLARNLLMYRYHNLQGARNKAKEAGFEGAMFPWESTDTGEETTPRWVNPAGDYEERIRIWTGDNEQHISTDISYAIMQYWRWTGEDDFFVAYGAEIVLDTAVFWGSRAEYNANADRYELSNQIGPDEYHENINNSAFTNSMVRWHLRTAMQVRDWLRQAHPIEAEHLLSRLNITDERVAKWQQIADKMYVPYDKERGIIEQFDGFMKLQRINLSNWQPRVTNMDAILGHEPTQGIMVLKQADIVMLMALLSEAVGNEDDQKRNWDFYYPVTDHGSSLSPSTHAWVAARLHLMDEAYKMFMFAATIDLEDAKGNVRDGIHAAAAGGMWQAAILGFAGLKLEDGLTNVNFVVDPHLPDHWKSVRFRIYHRGQQRTVTLTHVE